MQRTADRLNLLRDMKKRSSNPLLLAFGQCLTDLRGKASREQISIKLGKLAVPLGGSTLSQYEKGAVWAPDAAVLWGLSTIYGVAYETLVLLLRENRRHPEAEAHRWRDLLRQATDQTSDLLRGSDVVEIVAAHARIQQQHQDLLAATEAVAIQLADTLVAQGIKFEFPHDDARTSAGQPRSRKRARKAG